MSVNQLHRMDIRVVTKCRNTTLVFPANFVLWLGSFASGIARIIHQAYSICW